MRTALDIALEMSERYSINTDVVVREGIEPQFLPFANQVILPPHIAFSETDHTLAIAAHEMGHAIEMERSWLSKGFLYVGNPLTVYGISLVAIISAIFVAYPMLPFFALMAYLWLLKGWLYVIEVRSSNIALTFLDGKVEDLPRVKELLNQCSKTYLR